VRAVNDSDGFARRNLNRERRHAGSANGFISRVRQRVLRVDGPVGVVSRRYPDDWAARSQVKCRPRHRAPALFKVGGRQDGRCLPA